LVKALTAQKIVNDNNIGGISTDLAMEELVGKFDEATVASARNIANQAASMIPRIDASVPNSMGDVLKGVPDLIAQLGGRAGAELGGKAYDIFESLAGQSLDVPQRSMQPRGIPQQQGMQGTTQTTDMDTMGVQTEAPSYNFNMEGLPTEDEFPEFGAGQQQGTDTRELVQKAMQAGYTLEEISSTMEQMQALGLLGGAEGEATNPTLSATQISEVAGIDSAKEFADRAMMLLEEGGASVVSTPAASLFGLFGVETKESEYQAALQAASADMLSSLYGANLAVPELDRAMKLVPKPNDPRAKAKQKLRNLIAYLDSKKQNIINTSSMYGGE
jgi:hypothetical protein